MKTLYGIVLLVCTSFAVYAQSGVDSLFSKAYRFFESNEYDSSIYYFNELLHKTSSKDSRASALNAIGVSYSAKGLPSKSIPYYNQAIALYEELKDTATVITISANLAIIYKDKGLYEKALDVSFDHLPKLERRPPSRELASSYNTIGTVYMRIHDYKKGYEFYRKALQVRLRIDFQQGIGQSYSNLGDLFNQMKEYDSALDNLHKAFEIRKKLDDTRGLGRILTVIGSTLTQSGNVRGAISQLNEALAFNRTSNDVIGEIQTLQELGTAYISLRDFKRAEDFLGSSLELIKTTETNSNLRKSLELQADLYRQTNNKEKLNGVLEHLMIVKDSILNEERVESMVALEIQYETEQKEQEIALLHEQQKTNESELEKNRLQKIAFAITIFLLLSVSILGFRLYFAKQKEKQLADLHNNEMHHRTKNNLQMLSSFFTIQASIHEDDKRAQELIVDMQGRVKTMALVHNKLYKSLNSSELDIREYITELVSSLLYTYGFTNEKLHLNLNVDEYRLDIDKAVKIGLIVNELITNSLKYAYESNNDPSLTVSITNRHDVLEINLNDNGKNPLNYSVFENGGSFGIRMIKSFVRDLSGRIELQNKNGTSFFITIPLK